MKSKTAKKATGLAIIAVLLFSMNGVASATETDTSSSASAYVFDSSPGSPIIKVPSVKVSEQSLVFERSGIPFNLSLHEFDGLGLGEQGDVVVLWSNSLTVNEVAWRTLAWSSAQYTNVPGNWVIDGATGSFSAEATNLVSVGPVTIPYTQYNAVTMWGDPD
jgi:hypothetical protein